MNVHPFSAASPDMDTQELQALTESIRAQGQLVPILMWRGAVLDGRKRLSICEALGLPPKLETLGDEADPARVAVDVNVLRTKYTVSQRAMFAARVANATKTDAGRMRSGGATVNCQLLKARTPEGLETDDDSQLKSAAPDVITITQAAEKLGVQQSQVSRAKKLIRTAAPEVVAAVQSGHLTLHAANQINDAVPVERQPEVTAEVLAAKTGTRNTPSKIINAAAPGLRNTQRRDAVASMDRGFSALLATAESIEPLTVQFTCTSEQKESLTQNITHVIRILKRIERAITHGDTHDRHAEG